jgi:hypothetical protein
LCDDRGDGKGFVTRKSAANITAPSSVSATEWRAARNWPRQKRRNIRRIPRWSCTTISTTRPAPSSISRIAYAMPLLVLAIVFFAAALFFSGAFG